MIGDPREPSDPTGSRAVDRITNSPNVVYRPPPSVPMSSPDGTKNAVATARALNFHHAAASNANVFRQAPGMSAYNAAAAAAFLMSNPQNGAGGHTIYAAAAAQAALAAALVNQQQQQSQNQQSGVVSGMHNPVQKTSGSYPNSANMKMICKKGIPSAGKTPDGNAIAQALSILSSAGLTPAQGQAAPNPHLHQPHAHLSLHHGHNGSTSSGSYSANGNHNNNTSQTQSNNGVGVSHHHHNRGSNGVPSVVGLGHGLNRSGVTMTPQSSVTSGSMTSSSTGGNSRSSNPLVNMQKWNFQQLESHCRMLKEAGISIPQPLSLLLEDARRKEEKRNAKRVANRKSACTSRARKKAFVEEMTLTNKRLRRQALILALLPDLVVAITLDGKITFCSNQVERILRHKVEDLMGENLMEIVAPDSREVMNRHIKQLIGTTNLLTDASKETLKDRPINNANNNDNGIDDSNSGHANSNASNSDVAVVSEQSFPLSVLVKNNMNHVNHNPHNEKEGLHMGHHHSSSHGSNNESDESNVFKNSSSLSSNSKTDSNSKGTMNNYKYPTGMSRSHGYSSDMEDDSSPEYTKSNSSFHKPISSSSSMKISVMTPNSLTSSTSNPKRTEHKNATLTYENLKKHSKDNEQSSSLATAAAVDRNKQTSNELSSSSPEPDLLPARRPETNCSSDSGYREGSDSFQSREDTSSDTSSKNDAGPRPLAPKCNICLISSELTTIWCEVTSSMRKPFQEEEDTSISGGEMTVSGLGTDESDPNALPEEKEEEPQEILLCLRPISGGKEKISEEFRFVKTKQRKDNHNSRNKKKRTPPPAPSSMTMPVSESSTSPLPTKKRKMNITNMPSPNTKQSSDSAGSDTTATEKSCVESLMLMSSTFQKENLPTRHRRRNSR